MRIPALELEHVVVARLTEMLDNPLSVLEHHATTGAAAVERAIQRSRALTTELRTQRIEGQRNLIRQLIKNVIVGEDKLLIKIDWPALCKVFGVDVQVSDDDVLTLETTATLTRSGRAIRILQQDGRLIKATIDLTLVRQIAHARKWWQQLQQERGLTVTKLAEKENVTQSYVTRILRLAFLSPDVLKSIMAGKQPVWVDVGALSTGAAIGLDWDQQKHVLLLGRPA